jgi:molecular chaperone DnaJ
MAKNYYAVLGVLPNATLDEIRSAYRRRAKQYHPDYFGRDSAPFLGIQEAYQVLGDPESRSSYDRSLREAGIRTRSGGQTEPVVIRSRKSHIEPLRGTRNPMDFEGIFPQSSFRSYSPSFDEIFDNLWNFPDRSPETKSERFRKLTMEVHLTPEQARRGGRVQVRMPMRHPCSTCNGSGDVGPFQCWRCEGTGFAWDEFSMQVEYPPGIQDYYQIAIPLDRYGIHTICPILLFRISGEGDFEDLF